MTRDERRHAKQVLKDLLPRAERTAEKMAASEVKVGMEFSSPLGKISAPYFRIENAVGVHIYARFGGWYSDVLFDSAKLPPAAPDALGTPMQTPHKTREEAEENAVNLLTDLIINSRSPAPKDIKDDGRRFFGFFGIWLEFPADAAPLMTFVVDQYGNDPAKHPEFWLRRLDELKRQGFGDGEVTGEGFNALPKELRQSIYTVCIIVWSRLGLLRYPNDPEEPPQ